MGITLLFALLLSACSAIGTGQQNAAETAAAQTVAAAQTGTVVAEVNMEATQLSQTETALAMPTNTPEPSPTPTLTATPTEEIGDPLCNFGGFVEDVTVEDRSVLDPDTPFEKVWRLENLGECTWTTDYRVVFVSGYQMEAPTSTNLAANVAPGETVDISLNMVSPGQPGVYTGYWELQSSDGEVFGVGKDGETPFWVRIRVTEDDKTVVYNYAENACEAAWESSVDETIACPSAEDRTNGFIQPLDAVELENGVTYQEPSILTYPDVGRSGYMVGRFPAVKIEDGDHFQATIGCQSGAEDCNINFTLRFAQTGEGLTSLGNWHEVYEGLYYPIDIDLSDYAGEEIQIVLSAIAVDDTMQNEAIWMDPRIVRDVD